MKKSKLLVTFILIGLVSLSWRPVFAEDEEHEDSGPSWLSILGNSIESLSPLIGFSEAITNFNLGNSLNDAVTITMDSWGSAIDKYVFLISPFQENSLLDKEKFILVPLGVYTSIAMVVIALVVNILKENTGYLELRQAVTRYLFYFLSIPLFVVFVLLATKITDTFSQAMIESVLDDKYSYVYSTNESSQNKLNTKNLVTSFSSDAKNNGTHSLVLMMSYVGYFFGTLLLLFYGVLRRFLLTALIISAPITLALPIFPSFKTLDPVKMVIKLCLQQIGLLFGLILAFLFIKNSGDTEIIAVFMPFLALISSVTLSKVLSGTIGKNIEHFNYNKGIPYISDAKSILNKIRTKSWNFTENATPASFKPQENTYVNENELPVSILDGSERNKKYNPLGSPLTTNDLVTRGVLTSVATAKLPREELDKAVKTLQQDITKSDREIKEKIERNKMSSIKIKDRHLNE